VGVSVKWQLEDAFSSAPPTVVDVWQRAREIVSCDGICCFSGYFNLIVASFI